MNLVDDFKQKLNVISDKDFAALFNRQASVVTAWRKNGLPASIELKAYELLGASPLVSANFVTVKVYNTISCGAGIEPGGHEEIDRINVPEKYSRETIIFVRAKGRSMEPTIMENGYVGIDTQNREIVSGKMYAVSSQIEGAVIKRITVKDGSLILVPDNPLFPQLEVKEVPDYYIIGRVRLVMNEH